MYLQFFSPSSRATPFYFCHTKRHGNILTGTPLTGSSNAGGIGKNFDSERISGFAISNCCTVVSSSHLAAEFLLTAGIGRQSSTRYKQSRLSVTVYSARATKRGLALYTAVTVVRVYGSKARRYAEDTITESSYAHWYIRSRSN